MKYFMAFLMSLSILAAVSGQFSWPVFAKAAPKAPPPPPQVKSEICSPLQNVLIQVHALVPITSLSEVAPDKKDAVYAWMVKQLATENMKPDGEAQDYDFIVVTHGPKGYGLLAGHKTTKTACYVVFAGNDAEFLQITGLPAAGQGV